MIHSGFHRTILFLATLLLACHPLSGQHKDTAADSVMFAINMRLYDSIQTPSFPKMYKDALRKAQEIGNEGDYITVRRMLISRYFLLNEQEKFIDESDRMIAYCQESGTETATQKLYQIWLFKAERLGMWGRSEETWETVRQMAEYAQQQHSELGTAMAYFQFGAMYLDQHQLEESETHLRKAWDLALKNKFLSLAVRTGFNRIAVKMNTFDYSAGIAIADSIEAIILQQKADGVRIGPVTMLTLARNRCKLHYLNGDMEEAAAQNDTMLYWYGIDPDPSQWSKVLYTQAGYKMYAGDLEGACADFDSLARMAARTRKWSSVANYTYALADARKQQGNLEKAVDAYLRYAAARDSDAVQAGNAKLNELTKKFELNELKMARQKAKFHFFLALTSAVFLLFVVIIYFFYTRKLREKNRVLYDRIQEMNMQQEIVGQILTIPESGLTEEQKLFRNLHVMMRSEKLYRDPGLNRESLCSKLGTNTRYLGEAVRICSAGQTVSEFINSWRLAEAAELLTLYDKMAIMEIGEKSGFGSNATFFRLFRNHYGMSPAEYRQISKESPLPRPEE